MRVVLSKLIFDQVVGLNISIRNFPELVVSPGIIAILKVTNQSAEFSKKALVQAFSR